MKLLKTWEGRLLHPRCDDRTEAVLAAWCDQTDSYWPGLFYCYGDYRIPGTNNGTERHIKDMKQLVRLLSRSPNPAARFISHAATNSMVGSRPTLPGEAFLASRSSEDIRNAEKQLRAKRGRQTVQRQVRRSPAKFAAEFLEQWKQSFDPPHNDYPPPQREFAAS